MPNSVNVQELLSQLEIAQLMQNWGNWRDAGDWENLVITLSLNIPK